MLNVFNDILGKRPKKTSEVQSQVQTPAQQAVTPQPNVVQSQVQTPAQPQPQQTIPPTTNAVDTTKANNTFSEEQLGGISNQMDDSQAQFSKDARAAAKEQKKIIKEERAAKRKESADADAKQVAKILGNDGNDDDIIPDTAKAENVDTNGEKTSVDDRTNQRLADAAGAVHNGDTVKSTTDNGTKTASTTDPNNFYATFIEQAQKEKEKNKEKEEKKYKRNQLFNAIGDGISSLSNLYFTTKGAPNMFEGRNSLSAKAKERYDRYVKERDANESAYFNNWINAHKMDIAADKNAAQQQYLADRLDYLEKKQMQDNENKRYATDKRFELGTDANKIKDKAVNAKIESDKERNATNNKKVAVQQQNANTRANKSSGGSRGRYGSKEDYDSAAEDIMNDDPQSRKQWEAANLKTSTNKDEVTGNSKTTTSSPTFNSKRFVKWYQGKQRKKKTATSKGIAAATSFAKAAANMPKRNKAPLN